MREFDGPIPGANYTSDRRNYPWHRPPEFTDLDKAIEYIAKRLTKNENAAGILTMIEMGVTISSITQLFLISGMGAGKWTLDFALMLAGPTAHLLTIMAKNYGIKYSLGISTKYSDAPNKAFFETVKEINRGKAKAAGRSVIDSIDDIQKDTSEMFQKGGFKSHLTPPKFSSSFMKQPNPNEQEQMLGGMNPMGDEEEIS